MTTILEEVVNAVSSHALTCNIIVDTAAYILTIARAKTKNKLLYLLINTANKDGMSWIAKIILH